MCSMAIACTSRHTLGFTTIVRLFTRRPAQSWTNFSATPCRDADDTIW